MTENLMTEREWLATQIDSTTGLPLAKAGAKGKFSHAANAALAKAKAEGMEFALPEYALKRNAAKTAKVEKRVVSADAGQTIKNESVQPESGDYDAKAVRSWAASVGMAVSPRGRISAEVISAYRANDPAAKPAPVEASVKRELRERPTVRTETEGWGFLRRDPEKPFQSEPLVALSACAKCSERISYCRCADGPRCPQWMNGGEVMSLTKP